MAGKGHNKTLHMSTQYNENYKKMYENCTHRFNKATNICIHCGYVNDKRDKK